MINDYDVFKPIPIPELHRYEINAHGIIRNSLTKVHKHVWISKGGYYEVTVKTKRVNGKKRSIYKIHRLVAIVFIDNQDNKPQVNHIDGDKLNNHVSNLEWVTHAENMRHAGDTGLLPDAHGENNSNAKLTTALVESICRDYQEGKSVPFIMEKYNITRNMAYKIYSRTTWKIVSSPYKW